MTAVTLALSFLTACAALLAAYKMFGLWPVAYASAVVSLAMMGFAFLTLGGCSRGPTEEDMSGCPVSISGITYGDVAECKAQQAARREGETK